MSDSPLQVRHVYAHDKIEFERDVNRALEEIMNSNCIVGDIKYAIDSEPQKGGFGALIIFERDEEE